MTLATSDPNVLHDWLTVGPAGRLLATSPARPYVTRLLGAEVRVWRREDAQQEAATGAVQPDAARPAAPPAAAFAATLDGEPVSVQLRYGYIWIWPSGTPGPLFAFPEYDEPGRRIVDCDGFGVAVSGPRMVENFLDMGHFPFVHADYLGAVPHTEVKPYTVAVDEASAEIRVTECRFVQPKSSSISTEPLEVHYQYRIMQPLSIMLYKSAFGRPDALDAIALFVQPVDEERIYAYTVMALFDDHSSHTSLIAFQHTIFGQDKPVLENQVPRRLPLRAGSEVPTRCDIASVAYRRWLKARGMRYGVIAD